jgi:hypothetical protein
MILRSRDSRGKAAPRGCQETRRSGPAAEMIPPHNSTGEFFVVPFGPFGTEKARDVMRSLVTHGSMIEPSARSVTGRAREDTRIAFVSRRRRVSPSSPAGSGRTGPSLALIGERVERVSDRSSRLAGAAEEALREAL